MYAQYMHAKIHVLFLTWFKRYEKNGTERKN